MREFLTILLQKGLILIAVEWFFNYYWVATPVANIKLIYSIPYFVLLYITR